MLLKNNNLLTRNIEHSKGTKSLQGHAAPKTKTKKAEVAQIKEIDSINIIEVVIVSIESTNIEIASSINIIWKFYYILKTE